jgi:hypothetical protein
MQKLSIWSIELELFNWLELNIPKNTNFLEIGSGEATQFLLENWNLTSIEENIEWVDKYNSNYIYSPIKDNWYDLKIIKENINTDFLTILVDGPAYGERNGFFKNIDYFLKLNPRFIILDDVHRDEDKLCYDRLINYFNIKNISIETGIIKNEKAFAYIKIK